MLMIEFSNLIDKNTRYNTIQAYIIVILTLLPTISIFAYFKFAVVLLLVIINIFENGIYFSKKSIILYLIWGINIVLSAETALVVESDISMGRIVHEIQRLVFYLMLYLLCNSFRLKFTTLVHICRFLLVVHLGIQLLQYFQIGDTYSFLHKYYLQAGESPAHLNMAYWIEEGYFRSGSLFLNPNVYVLYPIIFELIFLQNMKDRSNSLDYCWLIACIVSIYLTGSRTGLVLFCATYVYNSITNKEETSKKIILPILLIVGFTLLTSNFGSKMGSRIFTISQGLDDSVGTKFDGLIYYLIISNPLYWLLGSLGSIKMSIPIDMEFGYIFAWFGIIGLFWYINIIKGLAYANKDTYKTLCRGMQIVIVLTAFSSSTILNMSIFPFISLIAYSKICKDKRGVFH
jgi:hypothetical protein